MLDLSLAMTWFMASVVCASFNMAASTFILNHRNRNVKKILRFLLGSTSLYLLSGFSFLLFTVIIPSNVESPRILFDIVAYPLAISLSVSLFVIAAILMLISTYLISFLYSPTTKGR
jgi:hypothetical protein